MLGATILGGLLAGGNFDRLAIQMPAWRSLAPRAWAEYSRQADLRNGFVVYPIEAIGSATLNVAAMIALHFDRHANAVARFPIDLAAMLALGGLLMTIGAAPKMLRVRTMDDEVALHRAFVGFHRWSIARGILQIAAFVVDLWALLALAA
jgi:hypothetical protein